MNLILIIIISLSKGKLSIDLSDGRGTQHIKQKQISACSWADTIVA